MNYNIRIKPGEAGIPVFSCLEGLVKSFASLWACKDLEMVLEIHK